MLKVAMIGKFGSAPESISERIEEIESHQKLTELLGGIFECDTLQAFEEMVKRMA